MGMNVKAIERKIAYLGKEGGKDQYMYVMQPLIYNKLTPEKAIQQAALHCGLTPAVMKSCSSAVITRGIAPREEISSVKSEIFSKATSPPGVMI